MDEATMASELGLQVEDLKDPAKVKEAAEKIEAENKASAEDKAPAETDKILNDQLGRLAKALEKRNHQTAPEATETNTTLSELDVDNRVFARSEKLSQEQIDVLNDYASLPKNKGKSFEDIAKTSAVKAEWADLQATIDAADELDTNASDEKILDSKNEIYAKHSKTGETPDTEYEHKVVAEKSLAAADLRGI